MGQIRFFLYIFFPTPQKGPERQKSSVVGALLVYFVSK